MLNLSMLENSEYFILFPTHPHVLYLPRSCDTFSVCYLKELINLEYHENFIVNYMVFEIDIKQVEG